MFYQDKYSEIAARFSNWLEVSTTDNEHIADLSLDYINRAIGSLLLEAPRGWDYLTNDRYELVLGGSSGLECSLPVDCGVILRIYTDSNDTKKPTIYYSNEGKSSSGFRIIRAFTLASGHTGTKIEFYSSPSTTPYLKYQILVPAFTGIGVEYCAFPGELILLEAQHIRCREKGLTNEWKMVSGDYEAMLLKFKAKHQNVAEDISIEINDANGFPVCVPNYSLDKGGYGVIPINISNDTDYVG